MDSVYQKACSKCGLEKSLSDFYADKGRKDGKTPQCKECVKAYREANKERIAETKRLRYQENKEVLRAKYAEYYRNNREEILERNRSWQEANRERVRKSKREYYQNNRERAYEQSRQWRLANPEKRKEIALRWFYSNQEKANKASREWQEANKKRASDNARNWREANLEKAKASQRNWEQENPDKVTLKRSIRRLRQFNNGIYEIRPKFIQKLYASPCAVCGGLEDIQADHVVPLARGGTHSEGNLQPLCRRCNSSKGAKFMVEFRQSRPDLFGCRIKVT